LLAEPLVATIFFGGEFTRFDVQMTALSLQAFALGLIGFSFVKILAPAYFAREDTKTPVKAGLMALVVNLVLSMVLAYTLTRAGYVGTHAGLALAISVAAILNAWLLYHGLRKDKVVVHSPGWSFLLLRFFGANAAMTVAIVWMHRPLEWWIDAGVMDRSYWLGAVVIVSALAYFGALVLLGLRPSQLKLDGNT
jgi:putative peptidoglycan lipid II flippase